MNKRKKKNKRSWKKNNNKYLIQFKYKCKNKLIK